MGKRRHKTGINSLRKKEFMLLKRMNTERRDDAFFLNPISFKLNIDYLNKLNKWEQKVLSSGLSQANLQIFFAFFFVSLRLLL